MEQPKFEDLKGKTITEFRGLQVGSDRVEFDTSDGESYLMLHNQDCCESVSIDEIHGEVKDLIGSPLLLAEDVAEVPEKKEDSESGTWTFYKLSTIRGSVTIKWYGSSNGYYSEGVDFQKVS